MRSVARQFSFLADQFIILVYSTHFTIDTKYLRLHVIRHKLERRNEVQIWNKQDECGI